MGIFSALENVSETWPVVLPLHPRTRGKLMALNYDFSNSKICFIDPVGYLEMVWLLKNCKMVMTDSGGLQKEAYFFGKYCVTMRDETEWVELVENGFNLLAGSDHDRILQSVKELQEKGQACFENRLYGKGDAGEKSTQRCYKRRKERKFLSSFIIFGSGILRNILPVFPFCKGTDKMI